MRRLVSPLCLVMALALAIAAFALWAVEPPQPGVEMHRAGAIGDDQYREALEDRLERRQLKRKVLLVCLAVGSGVLIVAAFLAMRPAEAE